MYRTNLICIGLLSLALLATAGCTPYDAPTFSEIDTSETGRQGHSSSPRLVCSLGIGDRLDGLRQGRAIQHFRCTEAPRPGVEPRELPAAVAVAFY